MNDALKEAVRNSLTFQFGRVQLDEHHDDLRQALTRNGSALHAEIVLTWLLDKARIIQQSGSSASLMSEHITHAALTLDAVDHERLKQCITHK